MSTSSEINKQAKRVLELKNKDQEKIAKCPERKVKIDSEYQS